MAKPLLSKEQILNGALSLLASDGVEALSARRLAAHMKCSPNTLYQQVGPRDALINELLARQFATAGCHFHTGETWQDSAHAWCIALRRALIANPVLTRLMTVEHRGFIVEDANALLKSLIQQGLHRELALRACKVLTHVVLGLCFTELQIPQDYQQQRRGKHNQIDADDLLMTNKSDASKTVPETFDQTIRWAIIGISSEETTP
jgi:AcrR family transcriptional regulator